MDWKEDYRRKLVPAEEAVRAVKSGDRVVITIGAEPGDLARALALRKGELTGVEIYANSPRTDFGWFDASYQSAFNINLELTFGVVARPSMDEKRSTYTPFLFSLHRKIDERQGEVRAPDVFMVPVSPPDRHGFCSFGATLWNRKSYALRAKKVLAEVEPHFIRTYGDNFIHVSQVTHFSERTSPPPPYPATPP
ncbi:MAG: hypothetical protein Q8O76_15015, partial [Chloroflexota bacterium]|nr:hypothetical protein [Chloroflexota bacterium]